MGDAIGQVLPSGVGVALSPLPIVAAVLMLGAARAVDRRRAGVIPDLEADDRLLHAGPCPGHGRRAVGERSEE